jgi:uncharacterized protein YfaQ (DUF2300 family)
MLSRRGSTQVRRGLVLRNTDALFLVACLQLIAACTEKANERRQTPAWGGSGTGAKPTRLWELICAP